MRTRKRNRASERKTTESERDHDGRSGASRPPRTRLGNQATGELLRAAERREAPGGRERLNGDLARAIQRRRGGGRPLPDGVKREAESAFNADFSDVRVHADERADALAQRLQARAFTVGEDVFFGKGTYDPTGRSGRELLGHELVHTVQQRQAAGMPSRVSDSDDRAEREATEAGRAFATRSLDRTDPGPEHPPAGRSTTRDRRSPRSSSRGGPTDRHYRATNRRGARSLALMTQVQRVDDNESIPTEVPRIERGPPEFSAEEFDTDLLIDEYYTTEDRILRMWAIALQSFQVLANSPAGEVSNAHLHKAVLEFAVGEVLGKLSKPAKVMKDLLDDAANEAAKARNVELEQSISNFFVKHLTAINALRDELNDKNRWKQHIRNLKRTAFGGEDVRPTRGEIWVFGGEGADETRKAFEEYWTLRTEFEELYVDANRRAQRASYFRFYQFLAENWLQHNRTVVWPGVERKAQLFIHVERDFTVREAVLRAPRGKQLAKGFEGLLEAVEEHEGSVISGVDVWDMRIRRRIRYYGRDPDEPYAHLPSHVIVIRRTGVVSEGESWGQDWESILERLRRDRPRIETLTGINE